MRRSQKSNKLSGITGEFPFQLQVLTRWKFHYVSIISFNWPMHIFLQRYFHCPCHFHHNHVLVLCFLVGSLFRPKSGLCHISKLTAIYVFIRGNITLSFFLYYLLLCKLLHSSFTTLSYAMGFKNGNFTIEGLLCIQVSKTNVTT